MWVQSLGLEDPLEEGMATHSRILAWNIPRTEEPGGLRSLGSQRVGHGLATEHKKELKNMLPRGTPARLSRTCSFEPSPWPVLSFFDVLWLSAALDSFLLSFNTPVLLQQSTRNWVSSSLGTADG